MKASPFQKMAHLSYVGPLVVALLFAQFRGAIVEVLDSGQSSSTQGTVAFVLISLLMAVSLGAAIFTLVRGDSNLRKPALWGLASCLGVASYLAGVFIVA